MEIIMALNLYLLEEFLAKIHLDKRILEMWEGAQLLQPVAFTDDQIPLYSDKSFEEVDHIRRLLEMGYSLDEIQKIIKKIGMPKTAAVKDVPKGSDTYLTVGNLADQVGVSPRTIKHWEDKGIIEPDTRSEGGFRLYSEVYVYLCRLIKDLQLFGFTLDGIKEISDYFRDFIELQQNMQNYSPDQVESRTVNLIQELEKLFSKIEMLKEGIQRWEELLKKKRKELTNIKNQNAKRIEKQQEKKTDKKSPKKSGKK
jgi:DNA-binding transcriptional MerR regulator